MVLKLDLKNKKRHPKNLSSWQQQHEVHYTPHRPGALCHGIWQASAFLWPNNIFHWGLVSAKVYLSFSKVGPRYEAWTRACSHAVSGPVSNDYSHGSYLGCSAHAKVGRAYFDHSPQSGTGRKTWRFWLLRTNWGVVIFTAVAVPLYIIDRAVTAQLNSQWSYFFAKSSNDLTWPDGGSVNTRSGKTRM